MRVVTKEELRAQQEETRRHFEVVAESLRDQMRTVAEGVMNLDGKLEGFRREVEAEFTELKSMVRLSYAELERRIHALEQGYRSLEERVARVEARQA
jgi:predicted RNase H-like nuclease (RuvC/YqgF family)